MKNYLYSANGDDAIDATMEALMFPADAITGMFGTGLTTTNVSICLLYTSPSPRDS